MGGLRINEVRMEHLDMFTTELRSFVCADGISYFMCKTDDLSECLNDFSQSITGKGPSSNAQLWSGSELPWKIPMVLISKDGFYRDTRASFVMYEE